MTAELLTGAAAIILSLIFSYVPGLNTKYAGLKVEYKRLIMLGLLVLVAGASYGLACWGILPDLAGIAMTCDQQGLIALVRLLVIAIISNQSAYSISPRTEAVKIAKYGKVE